jgi:aminoglycoside 3-N-acetyltransferase
MQKALVTQLREIGVQAADTVMIHASMRKIGKIDGGADGLIDALLEAVGPRGTLFAYADFEPVSETPHFDPARSPCAFDHGVFPEVLRRRRGTLRSTNPGASVLALGDNALMLTEQHPMQYGYGAGSPFERFVECDGKLLLLGSSLDAVTLLHYVEAISELPGKRVIRYDVPMLQDGAVRNVEIEEFDTSTPVVTGMPENYFELIVRAFLASEGLTPQMIGSAESYLIDARTLVRFARVRMESEYGG